MNLGRNKNQSLDLNAKVFFGGGSKIIPLLRDDKGDLAVDPANGQYWDYGKAYDQKLDDVYHITLSASYKFNMPKTTHEIFLCLNNVTNNQARINEYYDPSEPGSVGYFTQGGFWPNIMYKVNF